MSLLDRGLSLAFCK